MSIKWQRLRITNRREIPPLLFKYSSTSKGYELYITDLTNIWSEHLNHQDILRRADENDTTIDPSENAEQFGVLLQKIEDALRSQPGSTVTLNHSSGDSLELATSTQLPAPLQPLKWAAHLIKEPQSAATDQLLLPLIKAEADWESHQRSFIDQLHRKDWILAKLFDKIEAVGIDLSTIFPGISGLRTGQKGTTLAQAAKHIKGVAPFDEKVWLEEVSASASASGLAANILAEASTSSGPNRSRNLEPPPDMWWEKLTVSKTTPTPIREESELKKGREAPEDVLEADTDTATETEDDEFERQETPPRLKQLKSDEENPLNPGQVEDPGNPPLKELSPPQRQRSSAKPSKGLGIIGGKIQAKAPQPSPPAAPSTLALQIADDQTDSESDLESVALAPTSLPKPKPELSAKAQSKPRGLGVIGGKKKQTQATPSEPQSPSLIKSPSTTDQPPPATSPSIETRTKRVSKLGVIGGKPSKNDATTTLTPQVEEGNDNSPREILKHNSEPPRSPSAERRQPKTTEKSEREEGQEKADRKREELKRQLEAKSKAPAKKKRKF
ncbi:XRCC4-like factor-domain-containing protein [Aspergillus pseudonomiae]|uniref:Non-homologous end-joining factor 1 n=1 Tax=Aspergillus pseudonomiae TaxID=1506151 RepID=A0A5N6HUI2_9EURO|nr:XRCC4-like factor-domain-containing protein [Aspergillus pseudonomiae]KAB8257347.1 XRCC4-like factor-domain-containing protein [Aspergillus pseudonomiae]KAE8399684.1 XRCC4-like factor-domain-containing protein [Aspergillus pseudonomiae]